MNSKQLLIITWIFAAIITGSCKKKNAGEVTLDVETSPLAMGQLEAPAPGPNFPLTVTIKSAMPPKGATIAVNARVEGSSATYFTTSVNTTSNVSNISITGTTRGVVNIVNISVSSNSDASNIWTGSYKYSMK
jgi:hypothetical protein